MTSAFDADPKKTGWRSSELYKSQSSRLVNIVGYLFPARWLPVPLSLPLPWILKFAQCCAASLEPFVSSARHGSCGAPLSGKQAAAGGGVAALVERHAPPANFASRRVAMATPPQRTPAGSCACGIQTDKWTERERAVILLNLSPLPLRPPPSVVLLAPLLRPRPRPLWQTLVPNTLQLGSAVTVSHTDRPLFSGPLYFFGWLVDLP